MGLWKKVKFYYNKISTLTVTPSAPTNYPVSNLIDGLDGTLWKAPDATTQVIKHDKGARRKHPFDFLALIDHNFAASQPDISFDYSDDDVTYTTALKIPAKATFSRASVAYHSDGAQALSGIPRYEAGRDGKTLSAIMAEEVTTNLLTANQASVETDTTGFAIYGAGTTISRDTTYYRHGSASLKVVTPGNAAGEGAQIVGPAGTISLPYTGSIWIFAPVGATLQFVVRRDTSANLITKNFVGTGNWQRINETLTLDAAATNVNIFVYTITTAQAITFYIDTNQLEQKSYPTSWQLPGTARVNENLNFSTDGICSVDEGSINIWVNVNDVIKRQLTSIWPTIFQLPHSDGNYGIWLYHNASPSATWVLNIRNGSGGSSTTTSCADSLTPDGWHMFTVTWETGAPAYLYIDGVSRGTISSPDYPTAFYSVLKIGYYGSNVHYGNAAGYDDVQPFSRALTDAEIAALYAEDRAQPHPASRAFFNFDESLVNGALLNPAIVQEFTQIESRYQKLTLSNCATVPQAAICYWDEATELDYVDASFDPNAIERKANVSRSETGYTSGIHEKYTERSMKLSWEDADDTLYQKLADWAEAVGLGGFIVMWEGDYHGDEAYFMYPEEKFEAPLKQGGGRRDVTLDLKGRKL